MKVIIAGSRHMRTTPQSITLIKRAIRDSGFEITEEVCGCARGADTLGADWAEAHHIPVCRFPADWDRYKRAAGHIRNKQMADYADALIVFIWGGSRGFQRLIDVHKATTTQPKRKVKPCPESPARRQSNLSVVGVSTYGPPKSFYSNGRW